MNTGLEVCSVTKNFDRHIALSDISLTIGCGERLAVIGASGSGKSTLLRLLTGLEPPSAGSILLNGKPASEPHRVLMPPHLRQIGMVFQDLALWPNLSVIENVVIGLTAKKLRRVESRKKALDALALCRIAHLAFRMPAKISGGEQQRVALARALAGDPQFLLLDEPFSGLDLVTKQHLLEEVASAAEAKGIALVLVTHDPMEALHLCRTAIVFDNGRIEEAGVLKELLHCPRSTILRMFRDAVQNPQC